MSNATKFTVTQPVLCRNSHREYWKLDFFQAQNDGFVFPYICVAGRYKQCIPYKGNESYLRTTKYHNKFPKPAENKAKLEEAKYKKVVQNVDVTFSGTMQIKSK